MEEKRGKENKQNVNYAEGQSYQNLITDTYYSVKFFDKFELGVQDEILKAFRSSIFAGTDGAGQSIQEQLAQIIGNEMGQEDSAETEAIVHGYDGDIARLAADVYHSL